MYALALSFASDFIKAKNQQYQYQQQAQTAEEQAEIYKKNAYNTRVEGALNENTTRSQNRAYMADKSAAMAEAGNGYSPTSTMAKATSANALEQNVLNQRYEVESQAENYLYQAKIQEQNASELYKQANNSFASSFLTGSLLSSLF